MRCWPVGGGRWSRLEALLAHEHKPHLWVSYFFKPYFDQIPELAAYEKSYFFFEKPLKRRVSQYGKVELDLYQPAIDCNTGVLTAGIPIAVHMGCKNVVLTGCDSNYSFTAGSYFYAADKHASKTTAKGTLLKTWTSGGGKGSTATP